MQFITSFVSLRQICNPYIQNMKVFLFFVIFPALLDGTIGSIFTDGPSWNFVRMEDPITDFQKLQAVGLENKGRSQTIHIQYLCRALVDNNWVPGKLIYFETTSNIRCYVVTYTGSVKRLDLNYNSSETIQVLMGHASWTSWNPYKAAEELPEHFISGGLDLTGEDVPLCRIRDDDGHVYVGYFSRNMSQCVYEFDGAQGSADNIEILVLNPLGEKLNELS